MFHEPDHINHVHITRTDKDPATLWVGPHGEVQHDGSNTAEAAIQYIENRGVKRHLGRAALDELVRAYDPLTYVGAYHCSNPACLPEEAWNLPKVIPSEHGKAES